MRYIILIILCLTTAAYADRISPPPPLPNEPAAEQNYLQEVYANFNKLEVLTVNPDGTRTGTKGEAVLLITGGNYYLEVNVDSATTWRGVALTDTP